LTKTDGNTAGTVDGVYEDAGVEVDSFFGPMQSKLSADKREQSTPPLSSSTMQSNIRAGRGGIGGVGGGEGDDGDEKRGGQPLLSDGRIPFTVRACIAVAMIGSCFTLFIGEAGTVLEFE
jgi:hypothetical protein